MCPIVTLHNGTKVEMTVAELVEYASKIGGASKTNEKNAQAKRSEAARKAWATRRRNAKKGK